MIGSKSTQALDDMRLLCDTHGTKAFKKEIEQRSRSHTVEIPGMREIMKIFCKAIAYSQSARSSLVTELVDNPVFCEAFDNFEPERLAERRPDDVEYDYVPG
jgi:3-methyladenine DNA glycosylase Tag